MDTDAILASALDILSDEATVRNDSGDIVTVSYTHLTLPTNREV